MDNRFTQRRQWAREPRRSQEAKSDVFFRIRGADCKRDDPNNRAFFRRNARTRRRKDARIKFHFDVSNMDLSRYKHL